MAAFKVQTNAMMPQYLLYRLNSTNILLNFPKQKQTKTINAFTNSYFNKNKNNCLNWLSSIFCLKSYNKIKQKFKYVKEKLQQNVQYESIQIFK